MIDYDCYFMAPFCVVAVSGSICMSGYVFVFLHILLGHLKFLPLYSARECTVFRG